MIKLAKRAWIQDRGAALAVIATTLFLLMGVAAISADLAWYYLNASRVQRAADAAALAGVVHLPQQPGDANDTALDIAFRNGYDNAAAAIDVDPSPIGDFQLEVRISSEVDTFFAKVLGWDSMTIARTAVAEFIPPLKLGNPDGRFGNECDPANCPGDNFWANIHGHYTDTESGDAFSSQCAPDERDDDPKCATNKYSRETGYLYGIESASTFTVEFLDLAFRNISTGTSCPGNEEKVPEGCTSDWTRTGDRGCEEWQPSSEETCGPTMYVALYLPDTTPFKLSDNTLLCDATIPPEPQIAVTEPYDWVTPDAQACWQQTGSGMYVLQIKVVDPGEITDRAGYNRYSVRTTSGNLFAVGDFSLFNSVEATTKFYLAEVPSYYNGKTFVVELWDAGDAKTRENEDKTGTLRVIDPTGSAFDGPCRVYVRNTPDDTWSLTNPQPTSACEEAVATKEYNGKWLKFEMDLPPTYSCTDCWWKIEYDYPNGVNDTTTWRAYMIGNPIHLID